MEKDERCSVKAARSGKISDLRTFPIGYITGLLNKLTWEFEQKCPYYHARDEVNIYLPKTLNRILEEEFRFTTGNLHSPQYFRGFRILPGYEYCKIIIAHDRYPDTNDERYFHSVNITESVDIKEC